jgi:hypothetical protein
MPHAAARAAFALPRTIPDNQPNTQVPVQPNNIRNLCRFVPAPPAHTSSARAWY